MKTTFRYIVAVFVAGMALVSCSKENIIKDENVIPEVKGGRVITVSFGETMKSTLAEGSSTQPVFVNGDEIFITNGEDNEKSTVEVKTDPGTQKQVAIIRTSLPGALTAVYPYDAAIEESIDKQDGECPTVSITLKKQDGSFATANISKAEVNAAENMMTFENQTALLKVTLPENTTKLTVKSLSDKNITEDGKTLTIGSTEKSIVSQTGINYVAILPGVNLSDLSFDAAVNETSGSLKGIPAKTFATGDASRNETALNSIYKIGDSNWRPYVVIGGKKWATYNLGASEPKGIGSFYFWGGTQGYIPEGGKWVKDNATSEVLDAGFIWRRTPGNGGGEGFNSTAFDSWMAENCNGNILNSNGDAATVALGGSWRMPNTEEDLKNLIEACVISSNNENGTALTLIEWKEVSAPDEKGIYKTTTPKGVYFCDGNTTLFLPATGLGNGDNAGDWSTTNCNYWTSCLKGDEHQSSFYFNTKFDKDKDNFNRRNNTSRKYGFAIRPVSD